MFFTKKRGTHLRVDPNPIEVTRQLPGDVRFSPRRKTDESNDVFGGVGGMGIFRATGNAACERDCQVVAKLHGRPKGLKFVRNFVR